MGLLDDAIREHLDLKRRRGADPTEVERAEREALGPVRRPQSADEADLEAEPQLEDELDGPPATEADDEDWSFEDAPSRSRPSEEPGYDQRTAIYEPDFDHEEELQVDAPTDEPDADQERPEAHAGAEQDRPEAPAGAGQERPEAPEPRRSPRPHPAGGETVEYDLDSEHEAEATHEPGPAAEPEPAPEHEPGTGEDVLEETPEFLQDTPDHDRLWFEQRPPKDFDFGG